MIKTQKPKFLIKTAFYRKFFFENKDLKNQYYCQKLLSKMP